MEKKRGVGPMDAGVVVDVDIVRARRSSRAEALEAILNDLFLVVDGWDEPPTSLYRSFMDSTSGEILAVGSLVRCESWWMTHWLKRNWTIQSLWWGDWWITSHQNHLRAPMSVPSSIYLTLHWNDPMSRPATISISSYLGIASISHTSKPPLHLHMSGDGCSHCAYGLRITQSQETPHSVHHCPNPQEHFFYPRWRSPSGPLFQAGKHGESFSMWQSDEWFKVPEKNFTSNWVACLYCLASESDGSDGWMQHPVIGTAIGNADHVCIYAQYVFICTRLLGFLLWEIFVLVFSPFQL